jgi:hypothetical protein
LSFEDAIGVSSLAAIDAEPVVVARALGRGRVIVSGALDAWRYRAANSGFASFWTGLAWDAAMLAGTRLRVGAEPVVARPGEEVRITAELQGMSDATLRGSEQEVFARAEVTCGAERRFLRLWPDARPGSFSGSFRVDSSSVCTVNVTVADATGTVPVTFRDDLAARPSEDQQLEALAAAYDAVLVQNDDHAGVIERVRDSMTTATELSRVHPLRSPWWALPFALCLGGEWWLRRQSGLS